MKRLYFLHLMCCTSLFAGPTSLFWTNCTTDAVADGIVHTEVDAYVGSHPSVPVDIVLEYGFCIEGLKMEAGIGLPSKH